MNQLEGLLLLLGLSAGLLLAGYWLAAMLDDATPAMRLAVAVLAGLASLLLAVSVVNFFVPLTAAWSLLCLAPIGATLLRRPSRVQLGRDLVAVRNAPGAAWLAALGAVFFLLLLWPILSDGHRVFYDGTSNHDSFFWISSAEHLKRHSYMVPPVQSQTQPLTDTAAAITSWNPAWGRMGGEGLLALSSSLCWTSPLKIYIYATACLFLPWLAAVYLAVRTFYSERLSLGAKAAMVALQPIFVFFYGNANLPNLLGAVTGAAAVIATERILRAGSGPFRPVRAWWGLLVLSLHGLICSYPEMIPFVLLPCGLLWFRPWLASRARRVRRPCAWTAGAFFVGAVLNPASSVRAAIGFAASFAAARADQNWANLFASLSPPQYLPAAMTLSVPAAHGLNDGSGTLLTLLLAAGFGLAWWRARDRIGAAMAFAGSLALAAYTVSTGFDYGWQKTIQFAGIFFAAVLPAALCDALPAPGRPAPLRRWPAWVGLAVTLAYLGYAEVMNDADIAKWSTRKVISQDWFGLRELSQGPLRNQPVLVEAASFRMGFFYSMWSTYFLPDSRVYFGIRGDESGGYLSPDVAHEGRRPIPVPQAILVGRPWADSFDANSPRIATGREYALMQVSNRFLKMTGVYPLFGLPESGSTEIHLEILPHVAGTLTFRLAPRTLAACPTASWQVSRRATGTANFSTVVSGAPPWLITVPLLAGRPNDIAVTLATAAKFSEPYPFVFHDPLIASRP